MHSFNIFYWNIVYIIPSINIYFLKHNFFISFMLEYFHIIDNIEQSVLSVTDLNM